MNLYKVKLKGYASVFTGYVVALDPNTAVEIFREALDEEDIGFREDRELDSVTVIATKKGPQRLYVQQSIYSREISAEEMHGDTASSHPEPDPWEEMDREIRENIGDLRIEYGDDSTSAEKLEKVWNRLKATRKVDE